MRVPLKAGRPGQRVAAAVQPDEAETMQYVVATKAKIPGRKKTVWHLVSARAFHSRRYVSHPLSLCGRAPALASQWLPATAGQTATCARCMTIANERAERAAKHSPHVGAD